MSCCWACQKNNSCGKLYLEGEQQQCLDKDRAYESYENYVRWLAKSSNFTN